MVPYRKELSLLALLSIMVSWALVCRYQRITEEAVETFAIGVLFIWFRSIREDTALKTNVVPVRPKPTEPPLVHIATFEPIEPELVVDEGPLPAWLEKLDREAREK